MFEFVHSGPDNLTKDVETRKRVRSHAMRDYREKQRTIKSEKARVRRLQSGEGSRKGQPLKISKFFLPNESDDSEFDSHSYDESLSRRTSDQQQESGPRASLLIQPRTWGIKTNDPFESPMQVSHMLGICGNWVRWLRSDCWGEQAGTIISRAWESSPCPMGISATTLISIGHLDAVHPYRTAIDENVLRGRVLREVRARMDSHRRATSDIVITTLMLLASFELSRISWDAVMHLRGLKRIVDLRGGKDKLGPAGASSSLTMMLESIDIMQAIIFHSNFILTSSDGLSDTRQSTSSSGPRTASFANLVRGLPAELNVLQDLDRSSGSNELVQDFADILDHTTECICSEGEARTKAANNLYEKLDAFNASHCEYGASEERSESLIHFARACHQTLAILYNLYVNEHSTGHRSNESYVDGILNAVQDVEDAVWSRIPYTYMWILLTGLIASKDASKRSFITAHLTRAIYRLGPAQWTKVKGFLFKFMRLKQDLSALTQSPTKPSTSPIPLRNTPAEPGSPVAQPSIEEKAAVQLDDTIPHVTPVAAPFSKSFVLSERKQTPWIHSKISERTDKCVAVGWPLPNVELVCAGEVAHAPDESSDESFDAERRFHIVNFDGDFWFTRHT